MTSAAASDVSDGEAARVRAAANPRTAPSVLHRLAQDSAVLVRAAVAMNPAATPAMHAVLAEDADARVRGVLAARLAQELPGLAGNAPGAPHVRATLATLMEDPAVAVRAALAQAVRDMAQAPRELILRLAFDPAPEVADPVIRSSPVLTAADVSILVAQAQRPGVTLAAAARRQAD